MKRLNLIFSHFAQFQHHFSAWHHWKRFGDSDNPATFSHEDRDEPVSTQSGHFWPAAWCILYAIYPCRGTTTRFRIRWSLLQAHPLLTRYVFYLIKRLCILLVGGSNLVEIRPSWYDNWSLEYRISHTCSIFIQLLWYSVFRSQA